MIKADKEITARFTAMVLWLGDRHGRPSWGWVSPTAREVDMYPSYVRKIAIDRIMGITQKRALVAAKAAGVPDIYFTSPTRLTMVEVMNPAPAVAPKEEASMGIAREDLEVGGTCWLVSGYQSGAQPRRQRVKVIKIERAAATVRFLDGTRELVVMFKQLEADDDFLTLRNAREKARVDKLAADSILPPAPPAAFNPPRIAPKQQPLKLVAPTAPAKSDFDSWLEMGGEVLAALERDIFAARLECQALAAEREAIDRQLSAAATRAADLDRKRAALTALIGEPAQQGLAAAE